MSLKSPVNNFGSDNTKFRAIVTTAAAALIGTLVGGASVLGIVTAVTQPPAHDIKAAAQPAGGAAAPAPSGQAATLPPQTAPVVAERQSAPAAEGPRAVWPDALSARGNHDSEPAPATPAPQQALPPASDRSASNQSEQYGTGREPYAANSGAATARDSQPNPISPNTAPAKKRVVSSPPGQSADRAVDEMSAGNNVSVGKTRSDARKSQAQQARQQQRSPDTADRAGDEQAAGVYPPQRRVIIVPGPDQAANDDRGRWGGGLFDFFGQNHSDGDRWNQDHWNNDWHGSYDRRD
jgi:hypothetical protein